MEPCEHRADHLCLISTHLAGHPVPAAEDACAACLAQQHPKAINHVTVSKAVYTLHLAGHPVPRDLRAKLSPSPDAALYKDGPGTELERLISWFKSSNDECGCRNRILKMNRWGPDECERRFPTIRRWLYVAARRQGLPFFRPAVDTLIRRAIATARAKAK